MERDAARSDPVVRPAPRPGPPSPPPADPPEHEHERYPEPEDVMAERRREDDDRDQDRDQRRHGPAPDREPRRRPFAFAVGGQIPDQLVELADGLGLQAELQALLKFRQVKATLGMTDPKALRASFAIGVGGSEVRFATCDAIKQVVVGHLSPLCWSGMQRCSISQRYIGNCRLSTD